MTGEEKGNRETNGGEASSFTLLHPRFARASYREKSGQELTCKREDNPRCEGKVWIELRLAVTSLRSLSLDHFIHASSTHCLSL